MYEEPITRKVRGKWGNPQGPYYVTPGMRQGETSEKRRGRVRDRTRKWRTERTRDTRCKETTHAGGNPPVIYEEHSRNAGETQRVQSAMKVLKFMMTWKSFFLSTYNSYKCIKNQIFNLLLRWFAKTTQRTLQQTSYNFSLFLFLKLCTSI